MEAMPILQEFAEKVRREERERCAAYIEGRKCHISDSTEDCCCCACADAILSLGDGKE